MALDLSRTLSPAVPNLPTWEILRSGSWPPRHRAGSLLSGRSHGLEPGLIVCRRLPKLRERRQRVVDAIVVGCGVIGLTTAIRLQESGLNVRIVTAALPPETTSSVAAALWYPYKAYPEDRVLCWGSKAFAVFEELAAIPESGVRMSQGVELWREPVPDPWWTTAVPGVRRCTVDELPPGYRDGHTFVAPIIEMPVYLEYLLRRFTGAGGRVEQHSLSSLEEAGECRVIVNCTGLGARRLVGDPSMVPIRGQIVRVLNPGLRRLSLDEDKPEGGTYVVPRSQDCIPCGPDAEGGGGTEPDPK